MGENCAPMADYSVGKRGWELHKLSLPQTANQRVITLPWKEDWERARYCCYPRSRVFSLVIVVQLLSCVRLFAILWNAARQSFTISQSLLKLMSIESVIPSSQLILCCPLSSCLQSFPISWSFLMSRFFTSAGQRIGASASASVLTMNIQDWFPLGLTGVISFLSKGLSRVFSSTTIQKHPFFGAQPTFWSNSHICTWLLEKPQLWLDGPLLAKVHLCFLICCLGLSSLFFQGTSIF